MKKEYLEFIRENFACAKSNEPIKESVWDALIDIFCKQEIGSFYKFMSMKSCYTLENIKNDTFHFSRITELNDPFEFVNHVDISKKREQKIELLKCCFFMEPPTDDELNDFINSNPVKEELNEIKKYTFVYSLTTSFDNAQMWYSYGGDYNGICVEYDAEELFKKYNWRLAPIEYADDAPVADCEMEKDEIYKFIHQVCFTKDRKWNSEDEWRILKIDCVNKPEIMNDSFPPISVTIGSRVSEKNRKRLIGICKQKKIPVYQIKIPDGKYGLERELIEYEGSEEKGVEFLKKVKECFGRIKTLMR